MAKNRETLVLASLRGIPEKDITLVCEYCGKETPYLEIQSLALIYRIPRGIQDIPYQCKDEQHFACCHEHALLCAIRCMLSCIEDGDHGGKIDGSYEHKLLEHIRSEIIAK